MRLAHRLPFALVCLACASAAAALPAPPPAPPVVPVTEDYFGTSITDNYRYMEETDNPVFREWVRAEGRYARSVLDSIPARAALGERVAALSGGFGLTSAYELRGGREFWLSRAPGSDNFDLMARDASGARKLIDVAAIRAANGGHPVAINYFTASPDGSKVAVGLSEGGSENASLSVFDTASGRRIAGPVERVQFGPPVWAPDGASLYINRLAAQPAGAPMTQRYLNSGAEVWNLAGEPVRLIGPDSGSAIQPEAQQFPVVAPVRGAAIVPAIVFNGVQNEVRIWTAPADAPIAAATRWQPLTDLADDVTGYAVRGDRIYLLSHKDAPTFQVLTLRAGQPLSAATVAVPAREDRLIEAIAAASDGVYLIGREGLYSRLYRLGADNALEEIALPSQGSIDAGSLFADPEQPGVTVHFENWTRPAQVLSYDPEARRFIDRGLSVVPDSFRSEAFATSDLQASARDGVRVPFSVIRPADAHGPGPLLILAYGSYGISNFPYFSNRAVAVLSEGISYGVCHVRGGGELGEAWRLGGRGASKPNTWRDLIACADEAVRAGLTTPSQLFIVGGSAGGIPMGMAPIERPELFAGVIDQVPMASALRAEFQVNGPANIPEFGTVRDAEGFRNLLAMDGYQHVRDGTRFPPVLITTGLNDPRVDSWQPGKLAARLRAASPENQVLLRVDEEAGHGIGSTRAQTDALNADMIAFINWRLGREGWAPAE